MVTQHADTKAGRDQRRGQDKGYNFRGPGRFAGKHIEESIAEHEHTDTYFDNAENNYSFLEFHFPLEKPPS